MSRYYGYDGKPSHIWGIRDNYVSLSTFTDDILTSIPNVIRPFKSTKTVKVQTGVAQVKEPVTEDTRYERPDGKVSVKREVVGERVVREDPIIERQRIDDTPTYAPIGKELKVGDIVVVYGRGAPVKGTLEALEDGYFRVDDIIYGWQNVSVLRAK